MDMTWTLLKIKTNSQINNIQHYRQDLTLINKLKTFTINVPYIQLVIEREIRKGKYRRNFIRGDK